MGFLLKIVIFAIAAYGIWATARRWYGWLSGQPKPPVRAPERRAPPPPPSARRPVVEDTRLCAACGAYVSASAAKCGRTDCPQPA
jgi:hypothetical protein